MTAPPPHGETSPAGRDSLFLGNPIFLHEFRSVRRAPIRALVIVALVFLAAAVGAILLKIAVTSAADASRAWANPAIGIIRDAAENFQYFLPLLPLILFIRRLDRWIESGALGELALTPLRPETILAGLLGAWLAWGTLAMAAAFFPVMELSSPLSGSERFLESFAILAHFALHMIEPWSALLAGLPFALYLSLSHRRRVNAMALTGVFVVGLMFLVQNSAYLLTLLVSGSFRNRGVWAEHFIRAGLSLGLFGGMGLLFLMKAGARLSGYYIERLEGGAASGQSGGMIVEGEVPWHRAPMFPVLWRNSRRRNALIYIILFWFVAIAASGTLEFFFFSISPGQADFYVNYVAVCLSMFAPVVMYSLGALPRLWRAALRRRLDLPPGAPAPAGAVGALSVFKMIYYPLFYMNMIAALGAAALSFASAYWLADLGFFRAYHFAILLPISGFMAVMLMHLGGTFWILNRMAAFGAPETNMTRRLELLMRRVMLLIMLFSIAGAGIAGYILNEVFIQSDSLLSLWAWMLLLSLAVVFPLAAWFNLMIERRLRGVRFCLPPPGPETQPQ